MAKGNGGEYDNLEDEESSVNDEYCQHGEEYGDSTAAFGSNDANMDEMTNNNGDEVGGSDDVVDDDGTVGGEEYRPPAKRGRNIGLFR